MIVQEIEGNIIELTKTGHYDGMVQGCNCFCTMGAGLAPQVAYAFPSALRADNNTKRGDARKLGRYTLGFHTADNGLDVVIVNGYSQYETGNNGDYRAIHRLFHNLDVDFANCHLLVPLIGCGIAGLEWEKVKEIINNCTENLKITVVHYKT